MAAPIRKVNLGRKRWLLDLRSCGGRREFFETRELAEAAREAALALAHSHGAVAIGLTAEERTEFVRLRDRASVLGVTISKALDFWEAHAAKVVSMPFAEAARHYVEAKRATNKDPKHCQQVDYKLKSLGLHLGNVDVGAVGRENVETWLFGNGWAPGTIRNKLIDVRAFFRFCVRRNWALADPCTAIERVQLGDSAPGILTVEQCEQLLAGARRLVPALVPFIALGLFGGIRPEEMAKLSGAAVNMERGFVEVSGKVAKSRQRRLVDLQPNAIAWLRLFPFKTSRHFARRLFRFRGSLARNLGIERFPWPHDCLRHSFASYHLAMWGSADKTAFQMGHRSTDMVFRHYREVVTRDEAERFWGLMPI
jgi:integrase/recombinase XerD